MPFPVGSVVVVSTLGKKGRVVEATPNGRYRVVVGPMTVWCAEDDLVPVSEGKRTAGRSRENNPTATGDGWAVAGTLEVASSERERAALRSLDLHGMTVEEALRAVQVRLDLAIRAGLDRLEIIHGISGGRLRAAVRGYLAGISSISRFEPDARNPGVTWVYL
jgi:dsDNA-specific endonuclease/ATPase MutS2